MWGGGTGCTAQCTGVQCWQAGVQTQSVYSQQSGGEDYGKKLQQALWTKTSDRLHQIKMSSSPNKNNSLDSPLRRALEQPPLKRFRVSPTVSLLISYNLALLSTSVFVITNTIIIIVSPSLKLSAISKVIHVYLSKLCRIPCQYFIQTVALIKISHRWLPDALVLRSSYFILSNCSK